MDAALERRALDVYEEALGWAPETRQARLTDELGATDPALLKAVLALVSAETSADFLPTNPPEPLHGFADMAPPERIGVYRLTNLLGRGGMGVVYRGERADGLFDQTVAIKLVRVGLFSKAAAEQFTIERQILARLRHPHIAQLFDGGVTDEGLPYIVMELIVGRPITAYCEELGLGAKDRVRLFLDACDAIQYAHGQLVAHADIKPSNIVVDERYGVKLLDFGIAQLQDEGPMDAASGPMAKTPGYASPRQSRGDRPTPADDIFSLGVLLSNLVAGCDGVDADLRAVAAKAAAHEPERRYGAVHALAADLNRWLSDYPVTARPGGRRHALALLWRRRRLPIVLSAAAVVGLIAAIAVTTTLYIRAEAARRQAEQRFEEVHALARFMMRDVTDSLERFPGSAQLRRDLAVRGRTYLEGLSKVPGASRDLRLEAAEGYAKTGQILAASSGQNLGDPVAGKAALARAEKELRRLMAEAPERDDIALALARTLKIRSVVLNTADNQDAAALRAVDEAARLLDGVIAHNPGLAEARLERWDADIVKAQVLGYEGRYRDVLPLLQMALLRGRQIPRGSDPDGSRPTIEATNLNLMGDALYFLGDPGKGLQSYEAAAKVLEVAMAGRGDVRTYDRLAYTDFNVASTLAEFGRYREGLEWIDRGVATAEKLRAFEDSPRAHHVENIVRLQRAVALSQLHRYGEALAEARANIAARRARAVASPNDYEAQRAVPVALRPFAEMLHAAGRTAEACATLHETTAAWNALAKVSGLTGFDRSDETQQAVKLIRAWSCKGAPTGLNGPLRSRRGK